MTPCTEYMYMYLMTSMYMHACIDRQFTSESLALVLSLDNTKVTTGRDCTHSSSCLVCMVCTYVGPWCVAELMTGVYGVIWAHGVQVSSHFIPGSLTYLYGSTQVVCCMHYISSSLFPPSLLPPSLLPPAQKNKVQI